MYENEAAESRDADKRVGAMEKYVQLDGETQYAEERLEDMRATLTKLRERRAKARQEVLDIMGVGVEVPVTDDEW